MLAPCPCLTATSAEQPEQVRRRSGTGARALSGDHRAARDQFDRVASLKRALSADKAEAVHLYTYRTEAELMAERNDEAKQSLGQAATLNDSLQIPQHTPTILSLRGTLSNRDSRFKDALDNLSRGSRHIGDHDGRLEPQLHPGSRMHR